MQPGLARAPQARERRRYLSERRRAPRRVSQAGPPYGAERRSGQDDRRGDRRGVVRRDGIGLARDYFSQVEARVTTDPELAHVDIVRFG